MMKMGMKEAMKYSVPLQAASSLGRLPSPRPICLYSEGALHNVLANALHSKTVTHIVRDQVNSRDLLEHLIDVGKDHTVELSVLAHLEQTPERALVHLFHRFFNGDELVHDVRVVSGLLVQGLENFQCFIFSTLHHKPARGLRQVKDREEDHDGEENLKC